jgi:iron complex transport system substrate-binding protein
MKKRIVPFTLVLLAASLVITSCAPAAEPTPKETAEQGETAYPSGESTAEVAESPEFAYPADVLTEPAPQTETRFTIQADADLQDALTTLCSAFSSGEAPLFVESDGDLLATATPQGETFTPANLPATFLPGSVLIPQTKSQDAADFIAFALSTAGQQVLIDMGALPASVTVTDQSGNTVEIPQPVERVISAYGPVTSMVYAVDAERALVAAGYLGANDPLGSTAMENIDPRFPDLISNDIFSQSTFSVEEAAKHDPDLILANARSSWLETVGELDIPIVLYDAETPELLKGAVLLTGEIFGPHAAAQAQAWIDYYDWVTDLIADSTQGLSAEDRPNVLFTGTAPLRIASGEMYQSSMISIAGGISASAELTGYWNEVNLEQIAAWNPDVIIVPPYGGATVEAITEDAEWQILDAVQVGEVYQMPKLVAPWDTPAPDSVMGIIWLSQVLFPDQVELDCQAQAQYFFNTFYDYAIPAEELEAICAID